MMVICNNPRDVEVTISELVKNLTLSSEQPTEKEPEIELNHNQTDQLEKYEPKRES